MRQIIPLQHAGEITRQALWDTRLTDTASWQGSYFQIVNCPGMVMFEGVADDSV